MANPGYAKQAPLGADMRAGTDAAFIAVLTGTAPYRTAIDAAVAARVEKLLGTAPFAKRGGNLLYDGNRTKPENLGWRFLQNNVDQLADRTGDEVAAEIAAGKWDAQLAATYHDAADAEYYYRYEKDWG